jgi:hypothetical protein
VLAKGLSSATATLEKASDATNATPTAAAMGLTIMILFAIGGTSRFMYSGQDALSLCNLHNAYGKSVQFGDWLFTQFQEHSRLPSRAIAYQNRPYFQKQTRFQGSRPTLRPDYYTGNNLISKTTIIGLFFAAI